MRVETFVLSAFAMWIAYVVVRKALNWHRMRNSTLRPELLRQSSTLPVAQIDTSVPIPSSFDLRDTGLKPHVIDQDECGACWAIAACYALSERIWVKSGGSDSVRLSPQYLVNCEQYCVNVNDVRTCDVGCDGGLLQHAWLFLTERGAPPESCVPYANRQDPCDTSACPDEVRKASRAYMISDPDASTQENEKRIQVEIMTKGPVTVGFEAYQDFHDYRGPGVYRHDPASPSIGGHAARLIGWGTTQNGDRYWIGVNQWGKRWGLGDSVFKIPRGENYCDIEMGAVAGDV